MKFRSIFIPLMFVAVIMITINLVKIQNKCEDKIIYKYIPLEFNEELKKDVYVSQVFSKLFERPSTWIERVEEPNRDAISEQNNNFITQL